MVSAAATYRLTLSAALRLPTRLPSASSNVGARRFTRGTPVLLSGTAGRQPEGVIHRTVLSRPAILRRLGPPRLPAARRRRPPAREDEERRTTSVVAALIERELEIIPMLGSGLRSQGIRLWISQSTVKTNVTRVFARLGLRDWAQAVVAYDSGVLRPGDERR